jgi:oligoendopeptidase F
LAKKRSEIDDRYKWNLGAVYPDEALWDADFARVLALAEAFSGYAGRLSEGAGVLLEALGKHEEYWQIAERLYVYARQRRDEDNTVARYQAMESRVQELLAKISALGAFFTPEITAIDEETIRAFQEEEPELAGRYGFVLRKILREKEHVLPQPEEELLAKLSEVLGATNDIFTMLNDADMKFGEVIGEDGTPCELTHGTYIRFLESKDRAVRKAAYEALYSVYAGHRNTLAASYRYNTKVDAVTASIRRYPSSRAKALAGANVPEAVYDSLICAVNDNLPVLHRYLGARKRLLGIPDGEKLAMYDVYVPLTAYDEREIPFDEAVSIMGRALAPLGEDYVAQAQAGARGGWIDVYENEGKSSGAYSFGCYDSDPFILLNYTGKIKDVFTLVHEMGHSMHSWYTRRTQPFTYGSHSIFTAEVASTVNENLLVRHLLAGAQSDAERAYYLNIFIEEYRTTVFRQTMFAEFEKLTHEAAERGEALTSESLSEMYGGLNEKYFGVGVETDDFIRLEWSRIPHFYRAFYVYQYATGFSAAAAIAKKILAEGAPAAAAYREFLTTGDSDDPIELLRIAGVDMDKPETVAAGLAMFSDLVTEFDGLTGRL